MYPSYSSLMLREVAFCSVQFLPYAMGGGILLRPIPPLCYGRWHFAPSNSSLMLWEVAFCSVLFLPYAKGGGIDAGELVLLLSTKYSKSANVSAFAPSPFSATGPTQAGQPSLHPQVRMTFMDSFIMVL